MAYTKKDFPSKKAAKEALAASGNSGIPAFQPGPFGPALKNGFHSFEGPHFPKPHRWYGRGEVRDGMLISLK